MRISIDIDISRSPKTSPLIVAALPVIGAWLAGMFSPKSKPTNPVVDWSAIIDQYMRDEDAKAANGAQPPHASGAV